MKHVCHFGWVGKEAGYDVIVIGRVVLAELRQYWPSCSVSAEFSDRCCHIHTVLLIIGGAAEAYKSYSLRVRNISL